MLLECTCGKMYRVRDGATNPPKTCPACGGPLRVSGGAATPAPAPAPAPAAAPAADPRLKELESRLQGLERDQSASRAALELKEKELHEAQASIARLGVDLEKAQTAYKEALKNKEERIQELEGEATKTKAASGASSPQTLQLLRAKDEALREAQEKASALEQELTEVRQGSSTVSDELHEMEAKYKDALKHKEEEVDDLQKRLQAIEKQLVESASKVQQSSDPESKRLAAKVASLEKIIQDGENRFRSLQKQLDAAGEGGGDGKALLAEKDSRIAELEGQLADLRNRPPAPAPAAPVAAATSASNAKVGEARYLVADLDRSLGSISTALAGLVSRVRRLHETLEEKEAEAPAESTDEDSLEMDVAEEPPPAEPEAPPELPPIVEEPVAEEEAVPQLESFEAPAEAPQDSLPADETLLDMGGMNRPKKANDEPALEDAPTPPPDAAPEGATDEQQKKGFFGKLFGKKNKKNVF
jgi:hypothetical protein